jgi:hypothetical protein
MAISYNIYANDGHGGLVNYDAPIATTSGTTWTVGPLAAPSDNRFAVRAFDAVSGIEEANTDARVRVVIDALGNDVTARPNAVLGLSANPTAGSTCSVIWGYDSTGQGGPPSTFRVSLTPVPASDSNPIATVAYLPGVAGYGCSLSGLASGVSYSIAVQAVGSSVTLLGPPSSITLSYQVSPLEPVDALTVVASP